MPVTVITAHDARTLAGWIDHQLSHDERRVCNLTQASLGAGQADADRSLTVRRRVLQLHHLDHTRCAHCGPGTPWPCETVRHLILYWSQRPGYQPRWAPETVWTEPGWTP
jgi:4-alpha-glucanotransferase